MKNIGRDRVVNKCELTAAFFFNRVKAASLLSTTFQASD